mmetsp:Transcript_6989/g.15304  ORF Transcript_6989/g.15304 Transcript_6989/m.15304 type:complete len:389 (+) Transcript_6989:1401-2567(+)
MANRRARRLASLLSHPNLKENSLKKRLHLNFIFLTLRADLATTRVSSQSSSEPTQQLLLKSGWANFSSKSRLRVPLGKFHMMTRILPPILSKLQNFHGMPKWRPISFARRVRQPKPKRMRLKPTNLRSTWNGRVRTSSASGSEKFRPEVPLQSVSLLPLQTESGAALATVTPLNSQPSSPPHASSTKSGCSSSSLRSFAVTPSGKSHRVTKILPPNEVRKQDLQGMPKRSPSTFARRLRQPKPKTKPTKLSSILKGFFRPAKSDALKVKLLRSQLVSLPAQGMPGSAATAVRLHPVAPPQALATKSGATNSSWRSLAVMPSGKSHMVTKIFPPTAVRKQDFQGMPRRSPSNLARRKRQPKPKAKPMKLSSILNGFVRLAKSDTLIETL